MREAEDLPGTDKTSHQAIINWPHLTGVILGLLIIAKETLIIQQDDFFFFFFKMLKLPAREEGN